MIKMDKINFQDKDSASDKLQNRILTSDNINQIKTVVNTVIQRQITDQQLQQLNSKLEELNIKV